MKREAATILLRAVDQLHRPDLLHGAEVDLPPRRGGGRRWGWAAQAPITKLRSALPPLTPLRARPITRSWWRWRRRRRRHLVFPRVGATR